jgi:RND family efflux transporter MFP subunit
LDLEKAQLNKNKAQAEFDAWKKLGEDATDDQIKLRTGLTEAEIALKRAKYNFEKTEIKAPISGYISDLELVIGEQVSNGAIVFSIFNTNEIIVKANVLESEVNRIKRKSKVQIKFPGLNDQTFTGKVKSISPKINGTTRTCEVDIIIKNNDKIKHGMYADVKIDAENYDNQILVYKDALIVRDGKKLVFAVEGDKAKWQYVKVGEENENFIAITDGVKPDQKIVIDGNFSLSHDANVKIVEEMEFEKLEEIF